MVVHDQSPGQASNAWGGMDAPRYAGRWRSGHRLPFMAVSICSSLGFWITKTAARRRDELAEWQ